MLVTADGSVTGCVLCRPCLHVHPCASMCVHVRPCASMCVHVRPCASMCIHVRPCASMCIYLSLMHLSLATVATMALEEVPLPALYTLQYAVSVPQQTGSLGLPHYFSSCRVTFSPASLLFFLPLGDHSMARLPIMPLMYFCLHAMNHLHFAVCLQRAIPTLLCVCNRAATADRCLPGRVLHRPCLLTLLLAPWGPQHSRSRGHGNASRSFCAVWRFQLLCGVRHVWVGHLAGAVAQDSPHSCYQHQGERQASSLTSHMPRAP